MTSWLERVKHEWRRAGDWLAGRDVDVSARPPEMMDERETVRPAVDVLENDSELLFLADVPGAVLDTVSVHHDGGRLAIHARLLVPRGELLAGYPSADWYVSFTLPEGTDGARIQASLRDGVLTVHVPKVERPAPVQIPVRPG